MADLTRARAFVETHGSEVDVARLRWLLDGAAPEPAMVERALVGQRADGGWAPFWLPDYSSLDATCFRLAGAEQLGIDAAHPAMRRAIGLFIMRQCVDGMFEEAESVADVLPPWLRRGETAPRLYLTANCGFWLALCGERPSARAGAQNAADFLLPFVEESGALPSFPHADWLAAGLFWKLGLRSDAARTLVPLRRDLDRLSSSNLAWMLATLLLAGLPPTDDLAVAGAARLAATQREDGGWPSDDGPDRDLHATLEALRVLRWAHGA